MRLLSIILLFSMFASSVKAQRTVTLDASMDIKSARSTVDLTTAGQWYIQPRQDEWIKNGKTLYPDKDDRSQAAKDDQADVKAQLDIYVKEALDSKKFTIIGDGLDLSDVSTFDYISARISKAGSIEVETRFENWTYTLKLFPDLRDETARATAARGVIDTKLNNFAGLANAGNHYE